jgi:hypothetical protein
MNNKSNSLNIIDAIMSCDYSDNGKDYITSIMFDIFMGNPKTKIFIMKRYNKKIFKVEKILLIKCSISVPLQGRTYDVPILIYLPSPFPIEAPEVYIEKIGEIGINPKCINIDKQSFRIMTPGLRNWNIPYSNFLLILNEINYDFSNIFPVYKLDINERGKFPGCEECYLYYEKVQSVTFDAPSKQDKTLTTKPQPSLIKNDIKPQNNYIPDNNVYHNNYNHNAYSSTTVVHQKNTTFSDEQIKKIFLNELITTLKPKLREEVGKFKKQESQLISYKNKFTQQIESIKNLAEKKDEIIKIINSLSAGVQDQIYLYNSYIEKNKYDDNFENVDGLIKISDEKLIKVITKEAVLEDFLFYIKKAYEKKIFNFQDTIKLIRLYSREQFAIKYYREKLTNQQK